jgi:hypothetical protein
MHEELLAKSVMDMQPNNELNNYMKQSPLQKLTVTQLVKKFSTMETEGSLPCLQEPAIESDEFSLHPYILFKIQY